MEAHFERVLADEASRSSSSDGGATVKRRKTSASSSRAPSNAAAQAAHIEQLLAQADKQNIAVLDTRAVKSMASALQKLIRTNALQRSKYAETPAKFMDSEVALDEELGKWKAVGSAPTLYAQVIELGVLPMLLGLFTHENLDIRLDVLSLLADWTDVDEADFSLEPTRQLVSELLKHKLLPLLVTNLFQLAQEATASAAGGEEEAVGIYNSMQILENLADIAPESCEQVSVETEIFAWLLAQLGGKQPFSQNKLYASEILSILLQSGVAARQRFIRKREAKHKSSSKKQKDEDEDALDQLLQAIAPYRKKNPATEEEEELVENLLNSLCSVLLVREAQDRFRHLEGLELMLRCLKDNKLVVFRGALRVLDHAVMANERNSERLIEIGGLKSVFSVLMGKKSGSAASKKKKTKQAERSQAEENVTSLVASLCSLLRPDAKHDVYDRFHAKFVENDMEKMDRLVDLFVKYHTRVEQSSLQEDDEDEDEEDAEAAADERYLRRLDAGLFVLQRIAFVVVHLCHFSRRHQAYVMIKFHERNVDMEAPTQILREQVGIVQRDLDAARAEKSEDKRREDQNELEAKETQNRKLMALVEALEASQAVDNADDEEVSKEVDEPVQGSPTAEQEPVKNED